MEFSSTVYVGNPLCRSVDFMYTRHISGGMSLYPEVNSLSELPPNGNFLIFLSTVFFENLDPDRRHDDYPQLGDDYVLDRIDQDLVAQIHSGRCKVIIDYSGEAAPCDGAILRRFHQELDKRGFAPGNFGMITSNRAFKAQYDAWAAAEGLEPIAIFSYDHFVFHFTGTINIAQAGERDARRAMLVERRRTSPARKFVCLNNMPRVHRFYILSWLAEQGRLDEGYASCLHGLTPAHADGVWEDIKAYGDVSRAAFDSVLARIPLVADADTSESRGNLAGLVGGADIYADSSFSITTESEFSNGDVRRITEKVLKPLANLQPTVLLSSPGSLAIMRENGFRTFSPWVDEAYDDILDPVARMRAVTAELGRLLAMSADDLWRANQAMDEILLHNYDLLWSKAHGDYRQLPIHDQIRQFVNGN